MRFLFLIPIIFAVAALSSCGVRHNLIKSKKLEYKIEKEELKIIAIEDSLTKKEFKQDLKHIKKSHKSEVKMAKKSAKYLKKQRPSMSSGGKNKKPKKNSFAKNRLNIKNESLKKEYKQLKEEYKELNKKEKLLERNIVLESNVYETADSLLSYVDTIIDIEIDKQFMIDFEPVLISSWDDFYEKHPFFKNSEELQNLLFNRYETIIHYNVDRIEEFYGTGMISESQYESYLVRVKNGEVFDIELKEYGYYYHNTDENTTAWIPNVENMDIVDKASDDSTSSSGTIAYSVPDEMTVGNKYKITVRISKKKGTEIKKTLVLGEREISISDENIESTVTIENIRVERTMTVKLLSEDGAFEISPTSTDKQILEDESYTEWSWIVKPLESGTNYLKMIITVKVEAGDETSYKDIVVFDKNIKVKSNVSLGVKSWISEYWQWLMTTIIIPLVVFFYKKKNKKNDEEESE